MHLYTFDFDDNICTTPQCIRTVSGRVSTKDYAILRPSLQLAEDAFVELSDEALSQEPINYIRAPSWSKFVEALKEKQPVAIVTARANSETAMRQFVNKITNIEGLVLHGNTHIYCCNSKEFELLFEIDPLTPVPTRKALALQHFISQYSSCSSVGYSDDDLNNVQAIQELFETLKCSYTNIKFRTYVAK
jgi:hypothetical protein